MQLKNKILLIFVAGSLCVLTAVGGLLSIRLKQKQLASIYQGLQGQLTDVDFAITEFINGIKRDLTEGGIRVPM